MKITTELAYQIARRHSIDVDGDQEITRDICDIDTGSELDCWQLDKLTVWVIEAAKTTQGGDKPYARPDKQIR